MKQKVAAAHRRLDALFAKTRAALQRSGSARQVFTRLREALEAHFAKEDRLYYPPIWVLCPERKPALLTFVQEHARFRTLLAEIGDHLVRGAARDAALVFDTFAEAFALHEAGEEVLLEGLERELAR